MSVVPMQKVRLLVHATDVDAALDTIQRTGALEFRETDMPEAVFDVDIVSPNAHLLPLLQHAVHFLTEYETKPSLWRGLREGSQYRLTEKEIARYLSDTDAVEAIVKDLEVLQVEFADKNELAKTLEEKYTLLNEWKDLPVRLSELKTDKTTTLLLRNLQANKEKTLGSILSQFCIESEIPFCLTEVSAKHVAVTLYDDGTVVEKTRKIIEVTQAEVVTLPAGKETPDVEFVAVSEMLAGVKSELALLVDQAEHFSISHLRRLREAAEVLEWQHERFEVAREASATRYTVVFDGWLMADKRAEIEDDFKKQGLAAVLVDRELEVGEEPPVEIRNSAFVQPFEVVTRLYGMPGYKDLDPTMFLAGFFFIFFGFSLTDVGYGLTLMIFGGLILTLFKVRSGMRLFAKLMLFIGLATVIMGALFGGYLGFDPSLLPSWLQSLQFFDPIGDPLPVFYLALGFGVLQVMVGMMLKIVSDAKNGHWLDGVLDQGPWLFMFSLGILYLFTSLDFVHILSVSQIGNLAYVGVAMIVLASGRTGENVIQKFVSGAAGLYSGVGYFSDILSYSRLLALGLATSALAFAVNLIAAMVRDVPYVGIILWLLILLLGHVFTLAVNTLGAFVHSARLQFVEFFGKFITGTGKEFTPLARKEGYVTVGDD